VLLAIVHRGQHIHHRVTGHDPLLHDRLDALFNGRAKGLGDVHAHDFPAELKARVALQGLDAHVDFGELTSPTRLLFVAVLGLGRAGDGLLVGHTRDGRLDAQAKDVVHAPHGDVDMRVAHAR